MKTPFDPQSVKQIDALIAHCGGDPSSYEGNLIRQFMQTGLRLLTEEHDTGQLKLLTRALKEMRYAFNVFNQYPHSRRISIFGSARTQEDHPDYLVAKELSEIMAANEWMCITGASNGIMKAGLEGSKRKGSFGLSIRLPFEIPINKVIEEDPKHILFRYFFTRKLMFLSQSDAVAALPGGVGTMDELFEALTLIQTGKADIIPVVLLEHKGGSYWRGWEHYINEHLLAKGMISPEDQYLYKITTSAQEAADHIRHFYKRYHSSRYVGDMFVIRLLNPLTDTQVSSLNKKFAALLMSGEMKMSEPLKGEDEHLKLPRLVFHYTRRDFGLLRTLIDHINDL